MGDFLQLFLYESLSIVGRHIPQFVVGELLWCHLVVEFPFVGVGHLPV